MRRTAKVLVSDELWHAVAPLLPSHKPRPRGGRPPVDDRVALAGILCVLKTGIGWEDLPREIGCSGMTCWRRLRDWQAAGVWDALHRLLLDRLRHAERIDFSRVLVDSGSVRAVLYRSGLVPARRALPLPGTPGRGQGRAASGVRDATTVRARG